MNAETIDLAFQLVGAKPIPADHGYALYAAISRVFPGAHEPNGIAVHPIRGRQMGDRFMHIEKHSQLAIRMRAELIPQYMELAGKKLNIAASILRIGVPTIHMLTASDTLRSRLVTIKNGAEPSRFLAEFRRKLAAIGVTEQVGVVLGKRRTIRIREREIVGYEVRVSNLSPKESLRIQGNVADNPALRFSRGHMGCGVFVPVRQSEVKNGQ